MWNLFSEGILDSLMVVSLVSFCEEKFGLELTGHEFSEENLRTIAESKWVTVVRECAERLGPETARSAFSGTVPARRNRPQIEAHKNDKVGRDDRGIGKRVGNGSEC